MSERNESVTEILDDEMDVLLRELEGGESPPDQLTDILARHCGGEGARLSPSQSESGGNRWSWIWIAALLMLGVGVTWTVHVLTAPDEDATPDEREADSQDPGLPTLPRA